MSGDCGPGGLAGAAGGGVSTRVEIDGEGGSLAYLPDACYVPVSGYGGLADTTAEETVAAADD